MGDRRAGVNQKALVNWLSEAGFNAVESWVYPNVERSEHELAPLPPMYGILAAKENQP